MRAFLSKQTLVPAAASAIVALTVAVVPGISATQPAPAASEAPAPAAPPDSAPTVSPDRITLNPTADNETSQTVTWRTAPGVAGQAQISADTSNPWEIEATTVESTTTEPMTTDLGYQQIFHEATFSGLSAGTTYLYRVGDGTNWSGWMPFTTSNADAKRTSLLAFGDIQRGIKDQWTRVAAAAIQDRPDARAMISVGDQVNTYDMESEWNELFDAAGTMPRQAQWIPAVGNHEYLSTDSGELSEQFKGQFSAPPSPDAFKEWEGTVYTSDIDDVRVITLNSYYRIPIDKAEEQRWVDELAAYVEEQTKDNPRQFTLVNMHYPIYSSSPDRGNPQLRDALLPVFEEYGVDLVLQGHDQAYVSGQRDLGPRGKWKSGPLYVTSSSAGRHYPLDYSDWQKNGAKVTTAFTSMATYQAVDVEKNVLTYTAKDSTGKVLDKWTIKDYGRFKRVQNVESVGIVE